MLKSLFFKAKRILNNTTISFILATISGIASVLFLGMTTSNVFAIVFFLSFYFLFKKSLDEKNKKIKVVSTLVGAVLAVFMSLGKSVSIIEQKDGYLSLVYLLLFFVGFWSIFTSMCSLFYSRFVNCSLISSHQRNVSKTRLVSVFCVSVIVILVAWLPYFLRDYPGNLTPDSNYQLLQVIGKESLSNHHPIAHTMFIKMLFNMGLLLFNGNQTSAIALYSVVQAVLLAGCFAYLVETLFKFNIRKRVIVLLLAFFAIMPYHAMYSMTMWKDVLFGGIVLALTVTLFRIIEYFKLGKTTIPVFEAVLFFVLSIGMCLFRSNGLYAYILLTLLLIPLFGKKCLKIMLVSVFALVISLIIKGPIYNSMEVVQPDIVESLSVPAQHISRAISRGAHLNDEEYQLLSQVVDVERITETYLPYLSDPIKNLVREKNNQEFIEENKFEFIKLWVNLGLRNPTSYFLAQVDQTIGYWYPDVQYWVYATYMNADGLECKKESKVTESFSEALYQFVQSYMTVPYVGLLWSIGAFTWCIIVMLGFCILNNERVYLILFVPIVAIIFTLIIATPVHAEFRYAYSLFTTAPLLVVLPFINNNNKINNG